MTPKTSLAIVTAATGLFGCIAAEVITGGPLTHIDLQIAQWLHAHASPVLTQVMLAITHLHDTGPVAIAVGLIAIYLALIKDWYRLGCVGTAVPIGMLSNVSLSYAFGRVRPVFEDPLLVVSSYGFPSGHVAGATLCYGLMAAMLAARTRHWQRRLVIVLAAIMMVALVALTRLYLGVHYLSDVLAAFFESIAWLTLCLSGIHALEKRRNILRAGKAGK